jgi:hypothetical protein
MILSYSLDVRQHPLDILFLILMFSYSNYIIYEFFSLSTLYSDSGTEFIPKRTNFGKNCAFFSFTFVLPYWVFVKRDKLLSQLIKFKYQNIKFLKKNVKRNMANIKTIR